MPSVSKICAVCGTDCSSQTRYKDPSGNYYCESCYLKLQAQPEKQAAPAQGLHLHSEPSPAAAVSPFPTQPAVAPRLGRRTSRPSLGGSESHGALAVLLVAPFAVLLVLAHFHGVFGMIYTGGAILFGVIVGIFVLVAAFQVSSLQGLLSVFVPLYAVYFVYGILEDRRLKAIATASLLSAAGLFLVPLITPATETSPLKASEAGAGTREAARKRTGPAAEKNIAGHSVSIRPANGVRMTHNFRGGKQMTFSSNGVRRTFTANEPLVGAEFSVGTSCVMIVNEELIVNNETYGPLTPGDAIEVEDGTVFVNGKAIRPRAGKVRLVVN